MKPVVQGALVGVGGSVIIAIVSFFTTRSMLLRQLADAHLARVWEKQANAYVDAIAVISYAQKIRTDKLQTLRLENPPKVPEPGVTWPEVAPRLLAYASPPVLQAIRAADWAGHMAESRYGQWEALTEQARVLTSAGAPLSADQLAAKTMAWEAAKQAAIEAGQKEDALIDAIRADLHGDSGRALDLLQPRATPPAKA